MAQKISLFSLLISCIAVSMPLTAKAELDYKAGASERIRHEYWNNWKDMDNDQKDNRNFFRVRTSVWGQIDSEKKFSLFAKLTNEFRAHTYFGGTASSFPDKSSKKKNYHFDINEIIFDNLYIDYNDFFSLPLDLRIGRQDLSYGEGFLIAEGTPGDGSRTYYFNALKASLQANDKNTFDFIYISSPRTDKYLPVINETGLVSASNPAAGKTEQPLNTTDEQAGILYWKNKYFKDLCFDVYYIYKREAGKEGTCLQAHKGIINSFAGMFKYDVSPWVLKGQLALQSGEYGINDRAGAGGYGYIERDMKNLFMKPYLSLGYIYLSGDERGTSDVEGWNPLFSRYTWFSDLYNMNMSNETGITAYWTNLSVIRATAILKPTEKIKCTLGYNYLRANELVAASAVLSGSSKDRGHMPQVKIEYSFSKNINAYILADYLIPGKFYKDQDQALFLRTELSLKF